MEVINLIKRYKKEIFNKLYKDKKSFTDYEFITAEFKNGNITNNIEFKKVYRRFYVLNGAGLTARFIDRHFELLDQRETNLKKILVELSKIPRRKGDHSIQLSFASKLIHTIDNNQPIYDSRVSKLLNIKPNYSIKDVDERINDRLRVYNLLKKKFKEIFCNSEIKTIIKTFKRNLRVNIGDVKMLDFILWKLGGIVIKSRRINPSINSGQVEK